MSETNVQNVDQHALVDLFPDLGKAGTINDAKPTFGMQEGINAQDLFTPKPIIGSDPATEAKALADKAAADAAAEAAKLAGDQTPKPNEAVDGNVDILGTGVAPVKVESAPLSDLSSYYQDRIKSGKFVAIEDTDKDGKTVSFVPKTPEEYDEVLDLQISYRMNQAKKDLETNWYNSKSPAWKAISQYAELVDDPAQLIPFLQGVKTLTTVANLNEDEAEGAEQIVRTRLTQRGDPDEVINQQIDSLKTTDTLIKTAKAYKPMILQQEQHQLQTDLRQKQEQERQYKQLVTDIRDNALKSIEAPVFGKTKLKQDEKAAIYDLIAEPAEETQGYGIYNVIDNLFDKREFEKLKEIALLLTNREAFMNYLGAQVANATAASLERKLRLAGDSRTNSGNDITDDGQQARVNRNQFKTKPSFGR